MPILAVVDVGEAAETETATIERSISQFLNRVVETASATLIETYEERIRALEDEKVSLRERAAKIGKPRTHFYTTFRTAPEFLANPWKL